MNEQNDNSETRWRGKPGKIPHVWISKKGMDMAASRGITCLAVYVALARAESDSAEHKQGFFIEEKKLADLCNCSEDTINIHASKLHEMGLIRKISGRGKKYKGGHAANCYTLLEIDGEAGYTGTSASRYNIGTSLSRDKSGTKKESFLSPSEKGKRLSKEKGASAGTLPAVAVGSDSAPKKPVTGLDTF
jgi:hypothetical protein